MNRRILLAKRPIGMIGDDCFEIAEEPVPEPGDGEAVVKVEYLSLDPTIRGWLRDEPSYLPPVGIGEIVRSAGVGRIVASENDTLPVGMIVTGLTGWQDYAVIGGTTGALVQPAPPGIDALEAVSVFGVTGITAYFGLLDVGRAVAGDTLVVSGAAGAVGSIAGQIGKIIGCHVVGLAGRDEKCGWVVDDLGFDACINYKTEDVSKALSAACPNGIDVYFDNVGGDILDAALGLMNLRGRIAACGMIAQYNDTEPPPGPRNLNRVVVQRLRMEGFIILDYLARFPEAIEKLGEWVAAGKLQNRVHVVEGLLKTPRAINMLFTGENIGKLVVRV
ncbi:MAG: NADP-dependent oxidoreductase [Actinomycetota bacterium]